MENIKEAVLAAQKGDEEAFNRLYKETYERNYYIVVKMLKQEQDVMDVLQDTYVKVFQNLSSFQYTGDKSFASWTGKIASNTALDFLRRKKPVLFSDLNQEESISELEFEDKTVENQPELVLDQKETARIVQEMLECLSEEQRICLIYRYVRQMKISEIAEECGCSENTIKSRLNYAKKRLLGEREMLEKKGVQLYNMAPFTLLAILLEKDASAAQAPKAIAEAASGIIEMVFGEQGISAFYAKDAGKAGVRGAKAIAEKWAAGKLVAVIIVSLVLLGAGAGVVLLAKGKPEGEDIVVQATEVPDDITEAESTPSTEPTASVEPTPEPRAEEDIYYAYLNEELVPKYGLAELNQEGTLKIENTSDKENQWLKPVGILSAYIEDLDQNGEKELLVLYWKKEKDAFFAHELTAEVYEQEEGKVVCTDSVVISGLGYGWNERCDVTGIFVAADMTAGGKRYLFFSQYGCENFFTDGLIQGMRSMEYKDGKLQTVQEILQTAGGKRRVGLVYTGYTYKEGKKEEELLYDETTLEDATDEELEAYSAEAFTEYFKREKLDVTEIVKSHKSYIDDNGEETGFIDNLNKTKGATLICTLNTWSRNDGGVISSHYFLTGKDRTKLRKHITKK